jgi:glycosyltransferase involved in cell wall biosynthesis
MIPASTRILHIIDSLTPGGAEKVTLDMTEILARNNVSADILTVLEPGVWSDRVNPKVKQFCLYRKNKFNPFTLYKFYRIARRYNIVHVHLRHTLKYVWLAKKLFWLRKPIVFHEHYGNIDIDQSVSPVLRIILRKAVVVAVSKSLYSWAKNIAKAPRVFLLSNTVVRQTSAGPTMKKEGSELGLVLVANARPTKNIEYGISFIDYLNKTGKPARLNIYCQVVDADYFGSLHSQVKALELEDKIRFITDCDDIQAVLHKYDMGIHTAVSESGPLVLIEYICQGLPFLTYNTGEVVGQIKNDLPELIIDSFEPEEWKKRMDSILNLDRTELRQRMDKVYRTYYSEEEYFNKCIAIYEASLRS